MMSALFATIAVSGCNVAKKAEKYFIHVGGAPRAFFESQPLKKIQVGDITVG